MLEMECTSSSLDRVDIFRFVDDWLTICVFDSRPQHSMTS